MHSILLKRGCRRHEPSFTDEVPLHLHLQLPHALVCPQRQLHKGDAVAAVRPIVVETLVVDQVQDVLGNDIELLNLIEVTVPPDLLEASRGGILVIIQEHGAHRLVERLPLGVEKTTEQCALVA